MKKEIFKIFPAQLRWLFGNVLFYLTSSWSTHLTRETKQGEDLLNLLKPLGKHSISLGTALARSSLLQIAMVVDSLQLVPGQLSAGTQSCHQVVEDVEVLLTPGEEIERSRKIERERLKQLLGNWGCKGKETVPWQEGRWVCVYTWLSGLCALLLQLQLLYCYCCGSCRVYIYRKGAVEWLRTPETSRDMELKVMHDWALYWQ